MRIFTYGAPRVGNAAFAKHATDVVGVQNVFRGTLNHLVCLLQVLTSCKVVHSCDGVPTMVPTALGFQHYGKVKWGACYGGLKH